jgi:hypothetical protein
VTEKNLKKKKSNNNNLILVIVMQKRERDAFIYIRETAPTCCQPELG